MKEKIREIMWGFVSGEVTDSEAVQQVLDLFAIVGQSEQLVSFLRQYQKSCEIMHVGKIDAKNFVEQYKTN